MAWHGTRPKVRLCQLMRHSLPLAGRRAKAGEGREEVCGGCIPPPTWEMR